MLITDSQVHVFEADSRERPWPKDGRAKPTKPHNTAAETIAAMDAIGVDRAIIVPPGSVGDDNANQTALDAVAAYPGRFAVMGRIDPQRPDWEDRLATWKQQPGMLGLRFSGRWDSTPRQFKDMFAEGALDTFFAACERYDVPVALGTNDLLAPVERLAARHPGLTIIVDHLATNFGDTVETCFSGMDALCALARYPNVSTKVSNAPNRAFMPYPFTSIHGLLRRAYDAFGPRRLLWGADRTEIGSIPYAHTLLLWQEGLDWLSADDKEWILGKSAAEILHWPES
jgi:predicted TIM-barrel fold metal-dependent hydrolase